MPPLSQAWCKHTPDNPCAYCQDKHDEREWVVNFAMKFPDYWIERKRHLAELSRLRSLVSEQGEELGLLRDVYYYACFATDCHSGAMPMLQDALKAWRSKREGPA